MRKALWLLIWGSCGCSVGCNFGWEMPAELTPIAVDGSLQKEWSTYVYEAAEIWNTALEDRGCYPTFSVGDNGYPVILDINPNTGYSALTRWGWDNDIHVHAADNWGPILVHEMGHAIGLKHTPQEMGGIMAPRVTGAHEPKPFEIDMAIAELSCD